MKKIITLLTLTFLAAVNVPAQENKQNKLPEQQIIVNKKYNEKGDLTGFDSTAIITWKLDTTLSIGFPFDSLSYKRFPGIEQFLNEFWNDSIFRSPAFPESPFSFEFHFSPSIPRPNKKYMPTIPDTFIRPDYPFRFDSLLFDFEFDQEKPFSDDSRQQFMQDFEKRMNRYFFNNDHLFSPHFKNDEQRREWEELMDKQQREREEFQRKWRQ